MADQISEQQQKELEAACSKLAELTGYKVAYVPIDKLREQDTNARSMSQDAFRRLTANIERAGRLESMPFCHKRDDGTFEIISGHHRTRSARKAGLTHTLILYDEGLDADHVKSKQLSHNSINGTDDANLVREIFESITNLEQRVAAFVDPDLMEHATKISIEDMNTNMNRDMKRISLLFLPTQAEHIEATLQSLVIEDDEQVYLASNDGFRQWADAIQRIRKERDIRSIPVAINKMAALACEALDAQADQPPRTESDHPAPDTLAPESPAPARST